MDLLGQGSMFGSLIKTYIINFVYVTTKSIVFVVSCYVCWRLFDWLEAMDMRAEIGEKKNLGVAIMISAMFLGLGYVIGQM